MTNSTMRSCFVVWNNPEWIYTYKHDETGALVRDENGKTIIISKKPTVLNGMTYDEMCHHIVDTWCKTKKGRRAAALYCVAKHEDGSEHHHIHCVFESAGSYDAFRYTALQKLFNDIKFHCEVTRGNKRQVEDYIRKQGKYAEKNEEVLAEYQVGDLEGHQGVRSDLRAIDEYIANGMTPREITDMSVSLLKNEALIKKAYFRKREKETPNKREVKVIWHTGKSGTGKSYSLYKLREKLGKDAIYKVDDYKNGFDNYSGEPYLHLEEFRGIDLPYKTILQILDVYKCEIACRYTNTISLWNQVDITTVLNPLEVFEQIESRTSIIKSDSDTQLFRRLSEFHYHYMDSNGNRWVYVMKNPSKYLKAILQFIDWASVFDNAITKKELLHPEDEIIFVPDDSLVA